MKYFKDENNSVYAFESDGSQDDYIKPNYVEIEATEALNLAKPELTHEQLIAINTAKKSSLLAIASEKIATLTDAVDLDMATEEESSALLAWKKYRVLLNRVDTSTVPDIEWPEFTLEQDSEVAAEPVVDVAEEPKE